MKGNATISSKQASKQGVAASIFSLSLKILLKLSYNTQGGE
ncbi:hypothetical protein [Agathobacter sp.]